VVNVLAIQIAKGENVHKVSSLTLLYGIEQALKQALEAGQNLGQSETSLTPKIVSRTHFEGQTKTPDHHHPKSSKSRTP
jgi:hypothetical protein